MSVTASPRVAPITMIPARSIRHRVPADRCPKCKMPQGPFTERRGQYLTCVACRAHFLNDGTLLY